jgi:hypothetical protein
MARQAFSIGAAETAPQHTRPPAAASQHVIRYVSRCLGVQVQPWRRACGRELSVCDGDVYGIGRSSVCTLQAIRLGLHRSRFDGELQDQSLDVMV